MQGRESRHVGMSGTAAAGPRDGHLSGRRYEGRGGGGGERTLRRFPAASWRAEGGGGAGPGRAAGTGAERGGGAAFPPAGPRRVGERVERSLRLATMSKHVFLTGPPGNPQGAGGGWGVGRGEAARPLEPGPAWAGLASRPARGRRGCEGFRAGGRHLVVGLSSGPGREGAPGALSAAAGPGSCLRAAL